MKNNASSRKIFRKVLMKEFPCSNINFLRLIFLASVLNFQHSGCDDSTNDFQKIIPTKIIWAIQNNDIEIPCDVSPPVINDQVKLVLWFKDSDVAMYSLDTRKGGSLKNATHSTLAGAWTERIFFSIPNDLRDAKLHVRSFKKTDAGMYHCRVDFFNSPTRNFRVNVTLIESPDIPRIFDAQGKEILTVAGPYKEGHDLLLTCSVKGGNPNPRITWWHNGNEIKSSASHFSSETSEVVSQLFIENVTRDYYGSKFECRAQNSKILSPVLKEILVQIHLKPLKVEIVTPNDILSTGRVAFLKCETWGSHPAAKIQWFLDNEAIRQADIITNTDISSTSNMTSSTLSFKVLSEYDGRELSCKAMNPWFLNGAIEDNRRISVSYPPRVWIHAENEDHKKSVMMVERGNITLICRSDARPKVTSYSWFKNGIRIAGESTNILHIFSLEKEDNGEYSCSAVNLEGESMSSHLNLSVEFSPHCKPGTEQTSVVAAFMHSVQIKCEVEADPSDLIKFHWTYNNTRNVSPVPNGRIAMHGVVSTITHQVLSDTDEVTLACWATNRVGKQQRPCLTHVIPARVPETPRNCGLLQIADYISVNCDNGYDGGLPQNFILEVTSMSTPFGKFPKNEVFMIDNGISTMNDQATLAPIMKIQEKVPQFKVPLHDLDEDEYRFQVYAFNAKGQSDPFYILNHVKVHKNNSENENSFSENPISAETSNSSNDPKLRTVIQHSKSIILTAFAVSTVVMVAIISVACCVAVWCIKRTTIPKPDDEKNSEKMRSPRKAIPSMYGEEFDVECLRSIEQRYSPSSTFISIRSPAEDFAHYSKSHPNAHYETQH